MGIRPKPCHVTRQHTTDYTIVTVKGRGWYTNSNFLTSLSTRHCILLVQPPYEHSHYLQNGLLAARAQTL